MQAQFLKTVVSVEDLPLGPVAEIALAGRSNVGKSSLINALFNQRGLAKTSNTPGRTQALNYFDIGCGLLVDMPGYGYAKAPKGKVAQWNTLVLDYIKGRVQLKRLYVLIDARRGITKTDLPFLEVLSQYAVPYQLILTKADKIKPPAQEAAVQAAQAYVATQAAAHPQVWLTSSEKRINISTLGESITGFLNSIA